MDASVERARKMRFVWGVPALVSLLALTGCALEMHGEGTLSSANDPNQTAKFAFNYKVTDFNTGSARLSGVYRDGDVRLRFNGANSGPPGNQDSTCIETTGNYVSLTAGNAGTGTLLLAACESKNGAPSLFAMQVYTGPFAGYDNFGLSIEGKLSTSSS